MVVEQDIDRNIAGTLDVVAENKVVVQNAVADIALRVQQASTVDAHKVEEVH